jgi:hypothetical protein
MDAGYGTRDQEKSFHVVLVLVTKLTCQTLPCQQEMIKA